MRETVSEAVRRRFASRCGYCGVHEDDVGARLTVDHFQPVSRGGLENEANLVYCCHACNEFKGDWWRADGNGRLLHPLDDDTDLHLIESVRHLLVPLTERGRWHIDVPSLNRPPLIEWRRRRYREADSASTAALLINRFESLEAEIKKIREFLDE